MEKDTEIYEAIYQIGDIHIHGNRRIEYLEVFRRFVDIVKADKRKKVITVLGDTFHKATEISQEDADLFQEIRIMLLECDAPIVFILGNHDCDLRNKGKGDLLSIFNLDQISIEKDGKRIFPYKVFTKSGIYPMGNIDFHVYSPNDNVFYSPNKESKNIKVLLLHATIWGSTLQNNRLVTESDCKLKMSDLKLFHIVQMGDNHLFQLIDDTLCYSGSLIQQNLGEILEHGCAGWNLYPIICKFIPIHNDYAFLNFYAKDNRIIRPKLDVLPEVKHVIRMSFEYENCDSNWVEAKQKEIREKYNTDFKNIPINSSKIDKIDKIIDSKTISQDEEVIKNTVASGKNFDKQLGFIQDIAKEKKINNQTIDKLLELHTSFRNIIESFGGYTFKLIYIMYDNVLCYGENNFIDFTKLSGIISLIGDNASGKSSVIDILISLLYDVQIRKGHKKNFVRYGQHHCKMEIAIDVNEGKWNRYIIRNLIHEDGLNSDMMLSRYESNNEIEMCRGVSPVMEKLSKLICPLEALLNINISTQNSPIFIEYDRKKQETIIEMLAGLGCITKVEEIVKDEYSELKKEKKHIVVPKAPFEEKENTLLVNKSSIETNINNTKVIIEKLNVERSQLDKNGEELTTQLLQVSNNYSNIVQKMQNDSWLYSEKEKELGDCVAEISKLENENIRQTERLERLKKGILYYDYNCTSCRNNKKIRDDKSKIDEYKLKIIENQSIMIHNKQIDEKIIVLSSNLQTIRGENNQLLETKYMHESVYKSINVKETNFNDILTTINEKKQLLGNNIKIINVKIQEVGVKLDQYQIEYKTMQNTQSSLNKQKVELDIKIAKHDSNKTKSISDSIEKIRTEYPVTFNIEHCDDCKKNKDIFSKKFSLNDLNKQLNKAVQDDKEIASSIIQREKLIKELSELKLLIDDKENKIVEANNQIQVLQNQIVKDNKEIQSIIQKLIEIEKSKLDLNRKNESKSILDNINKEIERKLSKIKSFESEIGILLNSKKSLFVIPNFEDNKEEYSNTCISCKDNKNISFPDYIELLERETATLRTNITVLRKKESELQFQLQAALETKNQSFTKFTNFEKDQKPLEKKIKLFQEQLIRQKDNVDNKIKQHLEKLNQLKVDEANNKNMIDRYQEYKKDLSKYEERIKKIDDRSTLLTYYIDLLDRNTGFPKLITSRFIDQLNKRMNFLLSEITNFTIKITFEGTDPMSIDVIKNGFPTNSRMISGFQKFLINLVFRLSLFNITQVNIPKFLIIDEGFGSLDERNHDMINKLLSVVKNHCDFLLIISHIKLIDRIMPHKLFIKVNNDISHLNNSPETKKSENYVAFKRSNNSKKSETKNVTDVKDEEYTKDSIDSISQKKKLEEVNLLKYPNDGKFIILFEKNGNPRFKCLLCECENKNTDDHIIGHLKTKSHNAKMRAAKKRK